MRYLVGLADAFATGAGITLGILVVDAVFWDGRLGNLINVIIKAVE